MATAPAAVTGIARQRATARRRHVALMVRLRRATPWLLATATTIGVFIRARIVWAPEGDSALHLKLIEDIARTHRLPTVLPNFPVSIGAGGHIDAWFPYQYTPLFHLIGAVFFALAGTNGVILMNSLAAGTVAYMIYRMLARRLPACVAASGAVLPFVPPTTLLIYTNVYMEPVMLGFVFVAAWFLYVAMMSRGKRAAVAAGAMMGLAIGTRQVAMIYAVTGGVVVAIYLVERRIWHRDQLRRELGWISCMLVSLVATAAPFLAYVVYTNGTIGYADIALPWLAPTLAVDPRATGYISNITKPNIGIAGWINSYRLTLIYSERWLPRWYAAVPLVLFVPGVVHLELRGGTARFLARLAVTEVVFELILFLTTHGNSRYVIASRLLFYAVMPVGVYAAARTGVALLAKRPGRRTTTRFLQVGMVSALITAASLAVAGPGYANYLTTHQNLLSFRSRAYADAGAWIRTNTPQDSLFLVPRAYSGELSFDRNVTWVNFYGNAWVIDAIDEADPAIANEILTEHGVDYVLIQDPTGTYVDVMPGDGMRAFLQFGATDTSYFTLVYATRDDHGLQRQDHTAVSGLRIYRVEHPAPAGLGR